MIWKNQVWLAGLGLVILRETLFKTEDEIGAETLVLHFFATETGHKNVQNLLKLAETLA